MIRNLAIAGGRQIKNEDFTQYIQAFVLLEGLYDALGHGLFIFKGVAFTPNGGNFDISSGVIYAEGELCLFDGAANVALPHKLTKNRIGVNPREFQDLVTRNTGEAVKLQFDALGTVILDQDTPRSTDKFLRTANGFLRAPIDGNNNDFLNIWKGLLSDSVEMVRQIPKPTGVDRYLKLGEFPISETQLSHFIATGLEPNSGTIAHLTVKRTKLTPTDDAQGVITYSGGETANRPTYYLKRNDGTSKYELWVKSPDTISGGELTSGVIRLISEDFTDIEDSFIFESDYLWSATVPVSLVAFSEIFTTINSVGVAKISIDIGDWNMQSTSIIAVQTNLDTSKIRDISVVIRDDFDQTLLPLTFAGTWSIDKTSPTNNIELTRDAGSVFETSAYDSISFNRGYLTIEYLR